MTQACQSCQKLTLLVSQKSAIVTLWLQSWSWRPTTRNAWMVATECLTLPTAISDTRRFLQRSKKKEDSFVRRPDCISWLACRGLTVSLGCHVELEKRKPQQQQQQLTEPSPATQKAVQAGLKARSREFRQDPWGSLSPIHVRMTCPSSAALSPHMTYHLQLNSLAHRQAQTTPEAVHQHSVLTLTGASEPGEPCNII